MNFTERLNRAALPLGSALLLYSILGFFAGALRIPAVGSFDFTPRILRVGAALGAAVLLSFAWSRLRHAVWQTSAKWLGLAATAALLLLLASEYSSQSFIFFQGTYLTTDVLAAGVLITLAAGFVKTRAASMSSELLLLVLQALCAVSLLQYMDSRLIFADDHPSFLYRFQLLRDHFPFIPFYNTDWNGGYSGREFFPSGMLNVFLFFWPIVYFAGDIGSASGIEIYNCILLLYIFLIPWANYWAARLFGCSRFAAAAAGALALGPSLSYFEWLLRYGTLGFVFSAGIAPLTLALAYRLALAKERPRLVHLFSLLVFSFCTITWSLSALIFVPVTLAGLFMHKRTFGPDRRRLVLAFVLMFAVINGPWMKVFVRESKVFSFLAGETLPGSDTRSLQSEQMDIAQGNQVAKPSFAGMLNRKYQGFKQEIRKVNPVILFMFIPGLVVLAGTGQRLLLLGTVVWLMLIAVLGDALKPQLELRRMVIPASFIMLIPAGAALQRMLDWLFSRISNSQDGAWRRIASGAGAAVLSGILLLSPLTAAAHFTNKREQFYRFAPNYFVELAEAIKSYGGDGRTMFLGFILHDFGASNYAAQDGGHIAPLAKLSGKEMYASDYYHSRWSTVDPIPLAYRKRGSAGIEEFLDLVNVSAVVTFKREWLEYCRGLPEIYSEVYQGGRFRLFTRRKAVGLEGDAGFFFKGSGKVRRLKDGFAVTPTDQEVVIKYRYHPMLRAYPDGAAELYQVPVFLEDRGGGQSEQAFFVGIRKTQAGSGSEIRIGFYDSGS